MDSYDDDFGLLGQILQEAKYGVILLVDNAVKYSNREAERLLDKFPDLRQNALPFVHLLLKTADAGEGNKEVCEFNLADPQKRMRIIRIEITTSRQAQLLTIRDVTEYKMSGLIDKLTGLGNRAMFEHRIVELSESRAAKPVSIIEVDLDGLKLTNDVFGHEVGDILLKETAAILNKCVRSGADTVCRWGGDEFVILLPHTGSCDVVHVYDRILRQCEASELAPVKPRLSIGHATQVTNDEPLHKVLRRAESMMYDFKSSESGKNRRLIMESLKDYMVSKSWETHGHCARLRELCTVFGKHLGLSAEELHQLQLLAEYHDIGNVALSDELLNWDGVFTDEHIQEMQRHVIAGYTVVKSVPEYVHIATAILQHHENFDGTGYPNMLKGENICRSARILRILDSYEAMTGDNNRNHRPLFTHEGALEDIVAHSGKHYDPEIVQELLQASHLLKDI